jgi:arsenite/tail-anchored protein-transporting ATPase
MLEFLERPTRYLFFTGKGGVGKTSLATATAVGLADRGRRVLLVSTDPASNLGQVLQCDVGETIAPVPLVPRLYTLNIDPEAAAAAYRERVVGPVRAGLPADAVAQIEEQLSGACTTEIAAFDEFTALLTDDAVVADFQHIIFDTAPTGHTLRLLQLPAAWSSFLDDSPGAASCLGPLSGLQARQAQYASAVRSLADPGATTLVLATRPERSALEEAARTSTELASLGIGNQHVVVNGVFTARDEHDALAVALEERARAALEGMPEPLRRLPMEHVPLRPVNIVGLAAVRALLADDHDVAVADPGDSAGDGASDSAGGEQPASLLALVDEIAEAGHGLVMVMGKGGVGKTTIAAAVAVELASRGVAVHLSTTDPAAHVADAVAGGVENLTVSRIDPAAETRQYVDRVVRTRGRDLDEDGRRLLLEDLRSPCTEEVAVFHAFSRVVNQARRGVVILDTAPTGHTLLLLDATGAYHREVLRTSSMPAERVITPMMRLRDPDHTRILIATLPETTPVLEAAQLQEDLRRAGIEPWAWVINQSLAAAAPSDPVLRARAAAEQPLIRRVRGELAQRTAIVPLHAAPPVGAERLRALLPGADPAHAA